MTVEIVNTDRELAAMNGAASAIPNEDEVAGMALLAGHGMQRVGNNYSTAVTVQKPRRLHDVERRLVEEATLAGEDFYYGWGAGDNLVEGPSIELAVAAARCWGNCATEMLPIQETDDAWIFTAVFIDLETGYTRGRQFRQSKKWVVKGRMDNERKDDMRFQIGQSKAERNVILKALPASLVKRAMEAAKAGVRSKVEAYVAEKGLPAAVDLLVRTLAKYGVTEAAICEKFGVANKKALGIDEIVRMKGDYMCLEKGQSRADDLYPSSAVDKAKDAIAAAQAAVQPAEEQKPAAQPEVAAAPAPAKAAEKTPEPLPQKLADEAMHAALIKLADQVGVSNRALMKRIKETCGRPEDMTEDNARAIRDWLVAQEPAAGGAS